MNYTDLIRQQRTKLKLTRVDYAKLLGVSQNTVLNWETGVSIPDDYRIVIINQLDKKIEQQKKLEGNELLKILAIGGVAAFLLWALTTDNKPTKR